MAFGYCAPHELVMNIFPADLFLDKLPGPKRGESAPYVAYRDEIIWSPNHAFFALAYTIAEVSMCNEQGCVAWGSTEDQRTTILGNPPKVYAFCGASPWCIWLNDETFIFKAYCHNGKKGHMPLVVEL